MDGAIGRIHADPPPTARSREDADAGATAHLADARCCARPRAGPARPSSMATALEGFWRAHQVPLAQPQGRSGPAGSSWRPGCAATGLRQLFDRQRPPAARAAGPSPRRASGALGSNPDANGGLLRAQAAPCRAAADYAVDGAAPGQVEHREHRRWGAAARCHRPQPRQPARVRPR
jgi:phosphoketolase